MLVNLLRRSTGAHDSHRIASSSLTPVHVLPAPVGGSVSAMEFYRTTPSHDLTYSDVFLVPSRSGVTSRLDVSLAPDDGSGATVPIVSANMNSITGPRLAATLARRGGLGVLPQDLHLQDLAESIRWVKSQSPRFDTPHVFAPDATAADALEVLPPFAGHGIVLHDAKDRYVGCLAATRLASALPDARLGDLVHGGMASLDADDVDSPRRAFDLMVDADLEFAPVLEHGRVIGTLSRRSALRGTIYEPNVDASGRLRVAAAIGINGDVAAKAQALASAGVDMLVIDTAHGHQEGMLRAVSIVRDLGLGIPIVAGNIVTADAVADLIDAGADVLKVGVGPGAMCTTRMMTAVGPAAVLGGARDGRRGARARRQGVGRRRSALPARRRARARRRRGVGHDRVVVRGHHRGSGNAAARCIRPSLQGELGHGVDEGRARAVRPPRRPTSSPARSCSPRASRRRRSSSTRCARRSRTCST